MQPNPLIPVVTDALGGRRSESIDNLRRYFDSFSGRYFEHYSGLGATNRFDANDIAALATLSVPLDGPTVVELTERSDEFAALLEAMPDRESTIWETPPSQDPASNALYAALKTINGFGKVRTSKLLASKRPHLIPIRDSVVEALLGNPDLWWIMFEEALADADLRNELERLAVDAGNVPEGTSILRVLDVVLWQQGSRTQR